MRRTLVVLHRWFGLFTAVFLFLAGLTGAVIAWDHELDAWLNPRFYRANGGHAQPLSSLTLAARLEAADPRLRVRYVPLAPEPGHTVVALVEPRVDPQRGKPFELGFDEVALDPATGTVQGKRLWGEPALRRENVMPFLYRLHYSLHLPMAGGIQLGVLFMGLVALVWMLDAWIALWISFPNRKAWRKSFAFRFRQGGYRLAFDLHRSGGVWLWPLLALFAMTAVSMNLRSELVQPVVSLFSTLTPSAFEPEAVPDALPQEPVVSRERVLELARAEAVRRGIRTPPGGIAYAGLYGHYGVGFFPPGEARGDGGLGNAWLYFDGRDGRLVAADLPGEGSAGDLFMQVQFPLHSGRIAGVPGRMLVSLLGLLIATLSVTGVLIWARKRRARLSRATKTAAREADVARGSELDLPA